MANLKLDTVGDLAIEDNRLVLVGGADEIRQNWLIAIRTVMGEWFLDQNVGVPYFTVPESDYNGRAVTDKQISQGQLRTIFADATRRVPGVLHVVRVDVGEFDPSTRTIGLRVEATIESAGGDTQQFVFTNGF